MNLYDFNARFYDPILGRFTQVDPLADHASQFSLTPYQFAWNNPMLLNDPNGECPKCWDFIVGVAEGFVGHKRGEPVGNQGYTLDTFRQHDDSEGETKNEAHGNGRKTGKVLFEIVDLVLNPGSKGKKLVGLGKEIAESLGENAGKKAIKEGLEESGEKLAKGLTNSQKKAVKGLEDQITKHQKKLDDFKSNPDAFDNKGFLKDASPEVREKIINSRVKSLQKQINTFRKDIDAIKSGAKDVLEKGGN